MQGINRLSRNPHEQTLMNLYLLRIVVNEGLICLSELKLIVTHGLVNRIIDHSKVVSEGDLDSVDWTLFIA